MDPSIAGSTVTLMAQPADESLQGINNIHSPVICAICRPTCIRWAKKRGHKLMVIILSNQNRFTKFLHWKILWQICSKVVVKSPTIPCTCCHTTLWNINVR